MEKFEYSGLLLLFMIPTFWVLLKCFGTHIKKLKKLIIAMTIFGSIGYFIVIPLGAYWGAWGYDYGKTWGIRMGADLLETFFWTIAGCIILAIAVGSLAERIERKKGLRKKHK